MSGWWAVREVDHLFSAFKRYTRFVLYSKLGLVGVAALLVISLIAWPLISKDKSGLRVSFVDSKSVKQAPSSPVMENPEYRGVGASGQQYKITGKTATQQTPTMIVIDAVRAEMTKPSGDIHVLTADRAEYAQDKKLVDLFGHVVAVDTKGTRFTTSHATMNTEKNLIFGNEEVHGDGPMGKLVASGFEIIDNGNHIIFKGGEKQLRVTINRKKKQ